MKVGEAGDQARNVAAGSLHLNWHRDRVSVVFNTKNYRQAAVGGRIQRLPEFAFAGGAVAEGNVSDLVAAKLNILELTIVACALARGIRVGGKIAACFGAADCLQNLAAGAR